MMTRLPRALRACLAAAASACIGGCASQSETFTGKNPEQVWTALVAVAKTPDYRDPDPAKRWTVRENNVWVDDAEHRIEIQRKLERDLHNPASNPRHEDREWKIQVTMKPSDPPKAEFMVRNISVPAHEWDEAARYFNQVWEVLGGKPAAVKEQEAAAARPATRPATPPPTYDH